MGVFAMIAENGRRKRSLNTASVFLQKLTEWIVNSAAAPYLVRGEKMKIVVDEKPIIYDRGDGYKESKEKRYIEIDISVDELTSLTYDPKLKDLGSDIVKFISRRIK